MMHTPSFDFEAAAGPPEPLPTHTASNVGLPARDGGKESGLSLLSPDILLEQIIRDTHVLKEDQQYHVPSREFYEKRITAYKEALKCLPS